MYGNPRFRRPPILILNQPESFVLPRPTIGQPTCAEVVAANAMKAFVMGGVTSLPIPHAPFVVAPIAGLVEAVHTYLTAEPCANAPRPWPRRRPSYAPPAWDEPPSCGCPFSSEE